MRSEAATSEEPDAKEDEVLDVEPGEGDTAALDDDIVLTYATGESAVPVLTGKTPEQALSDARTAGFTNVEQVEQETDDRTAGVVFKQNPEAGQREKRSKEITITVAVAPPPEPEPTPTPTPDPSATPAPTPGSTPGGSTPTPGSTPG